MSYDCLPKHTNMIVKSNTEQMKMFEGSMLLDTHSFYFM